MTRLENALSALIGRLPDDERWEISIEDVQKVHKDICILLDLLVVMFSHSLVAVFLKGVDLFHRGFASDASAPAGLLMPLLV